MIPLGSLHKNHSKQEGSRRDDSESRKTNLATHNRCKTRHVNRMKHTRELEKKRNLNSLLMSLQLQITITLSLSLSLVFELNYKLKAEIQLLITNNDPKP